MESMSYREILAIIKIDKDLRITGGRLSGDFIGVASLFFSMTYKDLFNFDLEQSLTQTRPI